MQILLLLIGLFFSYGSVCQTASIKKLKKNGEAFLVISIQGKDDVSKNYWPSCFFRNATELPDSLRLSLIAKLLDNIDNDTSFVYNEVEALSYRYKGRFNKLPLSTRYNIQVAALVMINYIALSEDAIEYSPYPVLFDKRKKVEFTTTGSKLKFVIKEYRKWFTKIKKSGFRNYKLPFVNSKYEWYGTLYSKQRIFAETPKWSKFYDCPTQDSSWEEDKN